MTITIIAIGLLIIGLVLATVELILPGFGVFGILGLIVTFIGMFIGGYYVENFWIAIVITLVILCILIRYIKFPKNLTLQEKSGKDVTLDKEHLVGKEGIVITILKPIGYCSVEGTDYECYADIGSIDEGSKVVVKEIKDNKIIVKKMQ